MQQDKASLNLDLARYLDYVTRIDLWPDDLAASPF
jgi:hypothetical protein